MTWNVAYHSGMSSQSDFRACVMTGAAAGVVAGLLTTQHLFGAIPRFIREGGKLFIDSGAFTAFRKGEPMDWATVFRKYNYVIESTEGSPNVTIVAPDVVGDQDATVALWQMHRDLIRSWIDSGVRVLMPLQRGALLAHELLQEAISLLGTDRFCAGIPSNEAALPPDQCALLVHHDFHILGRVVLTPEVEEKVRALRAANPAATLTADANWLRSRTKKIQRVQKDLAQDLFFSRRSRAVAAVLAEEAYAAP
ncbi:hypothetical protein [Pseudomonas sp. GOM6]|uniref:hypothetical protein n=1 Tax=Pseudomonas sp. GOM6 TaxID=3036944 RepID=UPI00240A8D1D|nr:hypothetical protein [Pseudomonas sp. GOM6]MDG1580800.1 hypothetical protein [Pseudomonas sp. GOM6]